MNRVASRSTIAMMLVVVLLGGMCLFLTEYVMKADDWVVFEGSPHVYNGVNLGCGDILDRSGELLLSATNVRTYSGDKSIRKSTLHWLGDRHGYISAPAVAAYAGEMSGYGLVNGLYGYAGTGGEAVMTISAQVQKVALEAMFTQVSYVPGSVFKIVTAAAALDTLDNALELEFRCDGVYEMSGGKVKCTGEHGKIKLERAMRKSCNCYFAQLTEVLGAETLKQYVEKFQITQSVHFDGVTTAKGHFSVEGASAQEVAWAGIGQHLDTVNPCRYMTFMGAIAGGGEAAEPYIVASAGSGIFGRYRAAKTSTGRIMEKETAEAVTALLRNNVENQYGDDNFPGLTVCAKSGTAEVGGDKKPNAVFAGFCTDKDYPLAFMVVVENAGSGAKTCIPIISEVLTACKELLDSE